MPYEDIEIVELKLKTRITYEKRLQPCFDDLADIMTRRAGKIFADLLKQGFTRREALQIVKNSFVLDCGAFLPGEGNNLQDDAY